jgi:hypothetical protein
MRERWNFVEAVMSDPRLSDRFTPDPIPPSSDPRLPGEDVERTGGAMWGWIAGIAVLILIAVVLVGGWGSGSGSGTNTASNTPAQTVAPATTGAGGNGTAPVSGR